MTAPLDVPWSRRAWLSGTAAALAGAPLAPALASRSRRAHRARGAPDPRAAARWAAQAVPFDPGPAEALAQRAVDAAKAAGATYADARLTRDVVHAYNLSWRYGPRYDLQTLGVGVRALVNGYWGFAGGTIWEPDEAARLAREAVAVAKFNAQGPPRAVELGRVPAVTGRWATPVRIDPFAVPIEEKLDMYDYWDLCANKADMFLDVMQCALHFARQERVVATTEGTLVTQTFYESGGAIVLRPAWVGSQEAYAKGLSVSVEGIGLAGAGWERLLDARIPEQMPHLAGRLRTVVDLADQKRPLTVGVYTLVCDGATMAAMTARTLGLATQLDRALGYEANATGTSYLDDPLAMVGQEKVASPLVTLTADRSMDKGLATVKWDDEGVEPDTATLVKGGILTDFQTTRESAAWLKEYYAKVGTPVRSHGHAAAHTGGDCPLQQTPNLALAPVGAASLEELIGGVKAGVFVAGGHIRADFQAKTGMIFGAMRFIKNGKLGRPAVGGAVLFSSQDFWKKVTAVGGSTTQAALGASRYEDYGIADPAVFGEGWRFKGQPAQLGGHTVQAPAAVIPTQPVIDPARKA